MQKNIGDTDKNIRLIIGFIIIILGIIFESWFGLIGLIPIITSLVGWCPLYFPFQINTKKDMEE